MINVTPVSLRGLQKIGVRVLLPDNTRQIGRFLNGLKANGAILGQARTRLQGDQVVVHNKLQSFSIFPARVEPESLLVGVWLQGHDVSVGSANVPVQLEYGIARDEAFQTLLKRLTNKFKGLTIEDVSEKFIEPGSGADFPYLYDQQFSHVLAIGPKRKKLYDSILGAQNIAS